MNKFLVVLMCYIFAELIQNVTIEERVSLLEIQMIEMEEDVTLVEGDINILFDQQVIQDERLFILEQTSIETNEEVQSNHHLVTIFTFQF